MGVSVWFPYLMTLECPNAFAALWSGTWNHSTWGSQLPHFDCLIKTTANKVTAVRCKGHRVDAVLVAIRALQAFDEITSRSIPDPDTLIKGASRDVSAIRRNCNSGNAVLNAQYKLLFSIKDIPQADGLVAATRSDIAAVASEIKRVDILFMTRKDIFNCSVGNIPYLLSRGKRVSFFKMPDTTRYQTDHSRKFCVP